MDAAATRTPSGWRVAFLDGPVWPTVVLAAVLVVGLAAGARFVWGFAVVALVGVVLETLFWRHRQPVLRRGLRTDVFHFLFTNVLQAVCLLASAGLCYLLLRRFTIVSARDWLAARPPFVQGALGFVVLTLLFYWYHRLSHAVPFLWRFHAVHHSSEQLDWVAAARLHPMELFFGGFLIAPPVVLLGFDPRVLGGFTAFTTAWAILEHANVRWRLRFLDRIYPNPEYHHWHHSLHADAIDKNFGMPVWDLLFGTFHMPPDARPSVYGIREEMPIGYLAQLAQPFRSASPSASQGTPDGRA